MYRLVLGRPGSADEQTFEVRSGTTTIGRTSENDVCILDRSLSRRHARLDVEGGRAVIVDLKSKNGTFVNGVKVSSCELRPNDTFICGDVQFRFTDERSTLSLDPSDLVPTAIRDVDTQLHSTSMDELLDGSSQSRSSALKVKQSQREGRAQDKLRVLLKVSQLLSSPGPIESLLDRILQLAFQILEIDRAAILLVDPETGELSPRVTRTANGQLPAPPGYGRRIVNYVRTHNVAALFADAQQDSRLDPTSSVTQQSICSSMCVPLKLKDGLFGVLYVDNLSLSNRFSEEDLEFLTAFASQAAIAIENSDLYRRIEEEAILRNTYLRFFPPATIKKLQLSHGVALGVIETEATILFADISNFVGLSAMMRPSQVVDLLNDYFPVMADIIFSHEGTLEKYIGDALLAVWGAPFSHSDDVDRALSAAVEMHRALVALNARWRAQGRTEFQVHMGMNTGRVAAGNIGSERYLQYATIGDVTNVASRVCAKARAGELIITEETFERWRDRRWPVQRLEPTFVPGKSEPLVLYRVDWSAEPGGGSARTASASTSIEDLS